MYYVIIVINGLILIIEGSIADNECIWFSCACNGGNGNEVVLLDASSIGCWDLLDKIA
jgi:hypothetical protein